MGGLGNLLPVHQTCHLIKTKCKDNNVVTFTCALLVTRSLIKVVVYIRWKAEFTTTAWNGIFACLPNDTKE